MKIWNRVIKILMKHKKLIIFIFALFVSSSLFLSLALAHEANINNNYMITSESDPLLIKELMINGNYANFEDLSREYHLNVDDDGNLELFKGDKIEFSTSKVYNISVTFQMGEGTELAVITKNNEDTMVTVPNAILDENGGYDIDNYTYVINDLSTISILKDYMTNSLELSIIIVSMISIPLFYFTIKYIASFLNKLKNNQIKIRNIILYFISIVILLLPTYYLAIDLFHTKALFPIFLLLLLGLVYVRKGIKDHIHHVFIYLMIPIGILFLFTLPPENVPDENSHFYKSYKLSYYFNDTITTDKDGYCFLIPNDMNQYMGLFHDRPADPTFQTSARSYFASIYTKPDYSDFSSVPACLFSVKSVNAFPYILTTLWIFIGRNLSFAPFWLYLGGRLFNFFAYSILVYFAIKITPKFKKIFLLVSTLPIAIQQSIGFTQDTLTNAIFIFLTALILREIFAKGKIEIKNMLLIIVTSILLGFCKLGYFPVIFLTLLIPKERFHNTKEQLLYKTLFILPMILLFFGLYFIHWHGGVVNSYAKNDYTIFYFFENPIGFIKLYLNTIRHRAFYMMYIGLVDDFGWFAKRNNMTVSAILTICYTIFMLIDEKEEKNTIKYIFVTLFSALFIIFLILTSMLGGNAVGDPIITHIQPRYFILPLLLILTLIKVKSIKIEVKNNELTYGCLLIMIFLGVFMTLVSGYYM